MRVPIRVGLILATVALLAACGSVAAPGASGPRVHPGGTQLVARGGPPAGSRAEAVTLARLMLSRLRLPVGARRLPSARMPLSLRSPSMWGGAAGQLDLHQIYELWQPMDAVAAVLTARVPAGMSQAGTGEGAGPSGVTSMEVSYTPRSVPAGIYMSQLVLTVVPAGSGGSMVRADAQVIWFPPRTAAEYIDPARYHVLAITVTIYGRRLHTMHKVVTSQAVITRLAGVLNRSPVRPVQTIGCPLVFADDRLAFAVSRQARPVVVVVATRWPCEGAQIRVSGRLQPPLEDAGTVVTTADQVLGVTPRPPG
jgi:hypothetical protein